MGPTLKKQGLRSIPWPLLHGAREAGTLVRTRWTQFWPEDCLGPPIRSGLAGELPGGGWADGPQLHRSGEAPAAGHSGRWSPDVSAPSQDSHHRKPLPWERHRLTCRWSEVLPDQPTFSPLCLLQMSPPTPPAPLSELSICFLRTPPPRRKRATPQDWDYLSGQGALEGIGPPPRDWDIPLRIGLSCRTRPPNSIRTPPLD